MAKLSMFRILLGLLAVSAIALSEVEERKLDKKVRLKKRLERLEKAVNALEHFLFDENIKNIESLRDLKTTVVQDVKSDLKEVNKKSADMLAEVDEIVAEVREDLSEIETDANARNVIVGDLLYYHGIKSPCDEWYGSCSMANSVCRDGMCQCSAGFSYDSLRQTCVEECPHGYGNTYQVVNNHIIRGFNRRIVNETSADNCKRLCEEEQTFVCRSLDYFPRQKQCYMSASSKPDAEDGWEYNGAGVHFQRDCLYDTY
ncbi:hypothetical protein ACF0H5_018199 [Mactra antiquata]